MICLIIERTGDNLLVGRCCYHLPDGKTCPRHGDVSIAVKWFEATGKLTKEERIMGPVERVLRQHASLDPSLSYRWMVFSHTTASAHALEILISAGRNLDVAGNALRNKREFLLELAECPEAWSEAIEAASELSL